MTKLRQNTQKECAECHIKHIYWLDRILMIKL